MTTNTATMKLTDTDLDTLYTALTDAALYAENALVHSNGHPDNIAALVAKADAAKALRDKVRRAREARNAPKVGDPATMCGYSDRDPATVSYVSPSGRTVRARRDDWRVVSGSEHDGSAEYEYTPDPDGAETTYTLRRNGRYVRKGESMRGGQVLSVGARRRYYDPHF